MLIPYGATLLNYGQTVINLVFGGIESLLSSYLEPFYIQILKTVCEAQEEQETLHKLSSQLDLDHTYTLSPLVSEAAQYTLKNNENKIRGIVDDQLKAFLPDTKTREWVTDNAMEVVGNLFNPDNKTLHPLLEIGLNISDGYLSHILNAFAGKDHNIEDTPLIPRLLAELVSVVNQANLTDEELQTDRRKP